MSIYNLTIHGGHTLQTDDPAAARAFAKRHGTRLRALSTGTRWNSLPSCAVPAIARRCETPDAYMERLARTIKVPDDASAWVGEEFGQAAGGWRLVATDGFRLVAQRCEDDTDPPLDKRIVQLLSKPDTSTVRVTVPETIGEPIARLAPFRGDKHWVKRNAVRITVADGRLSFAISPDQDGDSATEDICACLGTAEATINARYLADTVGLPAVWHFPHSGTDPLVVVHAGYGEMGRSHDEICHVIMPVRL